MLEYVTMTLHVTEASMIYLRHSGIHSIRDWSELTIPGLSARVDLSITDLRTCEAARLGTRSMTEIPSIEAE